MNALPPITAVHIQRQMLGPSMGIALLHIHFADGRVATTDMEQKMFRIGFRAVYLDWDFEADQYATIPTDPHEGRREVVIRGATTDPRVVAIVRRFMREGRRGRFAGPARDTVHDFGHYLRGFSADEPSAPSAPRSPLIRQIRSVNGAMDQ